MQALGYYHPQLVHFAIALCVIGVLFRLVSLTGRAPWTSPAALTLLLLGGTAATLAVSSGLKAHGPVERIPGARDAVEEHEEAGELARNVFWGVMALEILAFALRRKKAARVVQVLSGLVGIGGLWALYEAGEHGGALVYSYAGGIGTRSGDSADVKRLLVAGLYNGALAARKAGRSEEAARLIDQLAAEIPADPSVKYLSVESRLIDRRDPAGALAAARALDPGPAPRGKVQRALLMARAYRALGRPDSARAVLVGLAQEVPTAGRTIQPLLDSLK
jgi:uncharacterized membrane protein